jgi:predicted nucleic acid-binding protein
MWPTIVVDANTLRNDIIYACRRQRQATTLVSAANSGLVRLFSAGHVLDDLEDHYQDWCLEAGVDEEEFVTVFFANYAPLLRAVADIPDGLVSNEEQSRIEVLRQRDPDDIPSVTLPLLLGAFYMSEDVNPNEAVFGSRRSGDDLRAWREVLCAGGDAGLLVSTMNGAGTSVALVGRGLWTIFDRLTRTFPTWARVLIAGLLAAGLGFGYRHLSEVRRQSIGNVAMHVGRAVAALSYEHSAALDRLRKAEPTVPTWEKLSTQRLPEHVLTRACLHTLARSRWSDRSAADLCDQLPLLPVPQGEAKVREVLRSTPCMTEVYRGRWQLGEALVREPIEVTETEM